MVTEIKRMSFRQTGLLGDKLMVSFLCALYFKKWAGAGRFLAGRSVNEPTARSVRSWRESESADIREVRRRVSRRISKLSSRWGPVSARPIKVLGMPIITLDLI